MGVEPEKARAVDSPGFVKRHPFEPDPGELGMGPEELQAIGELGDMVPSGAYHELLGLVGKLKRRREGMGLSLTDVSERSGLNRQAIGKLEDGHNINPTLDTLDRYAMALDAGVTLGIEEIGPAGADDDLD